LVLNTIALCINGSTMAEATTVSLNMVPQSGSPRLVVTTVGVAFSVAGVDDFEEHPGRVWVTHW